MTLLTTLRNLGEDVSLVLTLYEGLNFFPHNDASDASFEVIATASLNSEEKQESVPVKLLQSHVQFATEFEWSMSRQQFQVIRSRKVLLRVQFFIIETKSAESDIPRADPERKLMGSFSVDLREAVPVMNPNGSFTHDTTYEPHATYKSLINHKAIVGRPTPEVRYALVLEPNEVAQNTSNSTMQQDGRDNYEKDSLQLYAKDIMEDYELIPKLIEDKGYFLLGNEDRALETFYFNVYITHGKNLQRAISKPNAGTSRSQSIYYFSYDLFGVSIATESFQNLKDTTEDLLAEKASARIMTNLVALEHYFKIYCAQRPFQIDLCVGEVDSNGVRLGRNVVANCFVDLSKILDASHENLKNRTSINYDGVAMMIKATENSNIQYSLNASKICDLNHSESFAQEPHIGIRFSISENADEGLIEGMTINESVATANEVEPFNDTLKKLNQEFEQSFVQNPTNTFVGNSPTLNTKTHTPSLTPLVSPTSKNVSTSKNVCMKRASEEHIDREKNKSPRPDSLLISDQSLKSPSQLSDKSEPSVQKQNSSIGQIEIDTAVSGADEDMGVSLPIMTTEVLQQNVRKPSTSPHSKGLPSVSQFTKHDKENEDVSGPERNQNSSYGILFNSDTNKAKNEKSKISRHRGSRSFAGKEKELDLAALDIEKWKLKQKEQFQLQLEKLECHHINTLSEEWHKR